MLSNSPSRYKNGIQSSAVYHFICSLDQRKDMDANMKKRRILIFLAVIIAVVLPVVIYCNQIPLAMLLAKLWGPQAFNSESPPAYTLTELTMITRAGMVICLTMICETVASFIFAYALRIAK